MRRWPPFWGGLDNQRGVCGIQLLKKHGFSLRQIAWEVGCAVNTVRRQIAEIEPPRYVRQVKRPSKLAAYESFLRARQQAASPLWIPATVLMREIQEQGYLGGQSQLRAFMRTLKPKSPPDPVVRFETEPGEQLQVDWVEFRKGVHPLHAFCATLGFSRASDVEFVTDMKVQTLVACHERAFAAFGGVPKRVLYDNMKTVVLERDSHGGGQHRYHAGLLGYAKHSGFVIKLCRPYRAKTKGKVERFNGHLRRSFFVPLASRLKQSGLHLDVVTTIAKVEAHFGGVDVCVNNAGFLPYANCEETTPELWRKTLSVNLDGVFYVSQRVAPGMKSRGFGRIVNIASFGAKNGGMSPLPAYCTSKGGVVSLTFSFARKYAPFGVTCNALSPTFAKTQMLTEQVSAERQAELRKQIPVGRFCELEEIAHSVLFLAHPMSGFMTGEVMDLNGGLQFD